MIKVAIALLSSLILSSTPVDKEVQEALLKSKNRSAAIAVYCADGSRKLGSGFFFENESTVITANHVITCDTSYDELILVEQGGEVRTARVDARGQYDVARLRLDVPLNGAPVIRKSNSGVEPEAVYCIESSFPEFRVRCGRVTGLRKGNRWLGSDSFDYSIPSVGGTSGSPVVNEAGEVVGVHVATNHVISVGYLIDKVKFKKVR
jgi:S1-C subfamily serine protease